MRISYKIRADGDKCLLECKYRDDGYCKLFNARLVRTDYETRDYQRYRCEECLSGKEAEREK